MTGHIFISYSRTDGAGPALALADRLRARGSAVWIDQRNIPVTVPWMAEITTAIWGAAAFVVIDTPAWRSSENCQTETQIAQSCSAPEFMVPPGSDLDRFTAELVTMILHFPPEERTRSELFERADRWAHHGRQQRVLASGRTLAKYRGFTRRQATRIPTEVSAYLTASERRQRRRKTWRRAGSLAAVVLVLGGIAVFNGLHGAQQNIDDATQSFSGKQKYEAAWETNPYVHLDLLSQSDSSGTMDRAQFSRAFGVPLPDAVTAEGAAPQLQRNLDESRHPGTAPASGMVAQLDNSRRTITVERDGKPYRTITLSTSTPAMAWSPAQEWLLVADGPDVVAHDVNYGNDTLRLRGGKGNLTALAVDDDGVSGLTVGGEIIHWPTPFGSRVASNHSVFSDAVAIPDTDQALVLTDSGTLVTMSLPDSSVARTQTLPGAGPALSTTNIALSADGNNAVVPSVDITSGEATAILVSLTDSATRTFGLPGCVPFDSAWASPEIVYVACGNAGAGLLNITNGGFTLTPLPYSLRATSVTGTDSRLYVGTNIGLVLHMDPASMSLVSDSGTGCPQDMESLIVSHDGNYVYHGGDAAGNAGCGARGNFTNPAEPRWDRLVYPWQTIDRAAATALSDDGKFVAFGFADGTIRVFTTDTGEPIVIVRPATGSVRGLAFNSSGSQILAVTNDGTALQIGVDVKAADLTHQRQRANELLARAGELGLYG